MSNCKINIIIACCLFTFSGCLETKYPFDIGTSIGEHAGDFLKKLPGIKNPKYNTYKVTSKAKKIEVYKASFKEATIEKDNLLEITELNDKSTLPRAGYRETDGFIQDLYLLKYNFKYDADGTVTEATAAVFLSIRYRPTDAEPFLYYTGPGPLYWGLVMDDYISFDSVLVIKKKKAKPYLLAKKRKKGKDFNLLFMPAAFAKNPERKGASFNITKIVRMDPNRIGGVKPLVFDIPEIFKDKKAMHFDYIKTITLNH
jgi:hypothetical protein